MENPFEIIDKRLSAIEGLLADLKQINQSAVLKSLKIEKLSDDSDWPNSWTKEYLQDILKSTSPDKVPLYDLSLSVRAFNQLKSRGINTLYDLLNLPDHDFKKQRGVGKKVYAEFHNLKYIALGLSQQFIVEKLEH